MPFEVKGYIPSIKPGAYQAVCTSVEERSPKADPTNIFRVWTFELADGSHRTVDGSSSLASSPKSKGGKWLRAILGREPIEGETVAPEGMPCTIIVAIKETTGYEYVETVAPPATPADSSVTITATNTAAAIHAAQEDDPTSDLPF